MPGMEVAEGWLCVLEAAVAVGWGFCSLKAADPPQRLQGMSPSSSP